MLFSLKIALDTFLPVMAVISSTAKWQYALLYMKIIVVFSMKPKYHIEHTWLVLHLLKEASVKLELKKRDQVSTPRKLEMEEHIADPIYKLKVPTTMTELRLFLGRCYVSRRFVPKIRTISSPLSKWLCRSQVKELGILIEEKLSAVETPN